MGDVIDLEQHRCATRNRKPQPASGATRFSTDQQDDIEAIKRTLRALIDEVNSHPSSGRR